MKRRLLCFTLALISLLSGCVFVETDKIYKTKYVTDTEVLQMREKPNNEASIICDIKEGDALSVVRDAKNGYSEVVYNGVTGYVLAAYLTEEKKPQMQSQPAKVTDSSQNKPTKTPVVDKIIDDYVNDVCKKIYYEVEENLSAYSKSTEGEATVWKDEIGYVKKEFTSGENGYNMSRQYYYDSTTGDVVFAFIFKDSKEEHRLYFKAGEVVRYIKPSKVVIDNPSNDEISNLSERVMSEAF